MGQNQESFQHRQTRVDFADAVAVFEDGLALTRPVPDAQGEKRFITLGLDAFGRIWLLFLLSASRLSALSRRGSRPSRSEKHMKAEYDFSKAKRGAVVATPPGKTRITIRLDNEVIEWFRAHVNEAGGGNYQSLINEALKSHIQNQGLEKTLRRLIREELKRVA